jgi:Domain of unknown function (DUF4226)
MGALEDLRDAIKHVQDCTGDVNAWQRGLPPDAVATIPVNPQAAATLLAQIRRAHPDLFNARTGASTSPQPGRPQSGAAVDAIQAAEVGLARQNSATAQLDLHAITAILNAHATTAEGTAALNRLQQAIEDAVTSRKDLDTPAGARDFQRFLIGKLRDIRQVVETASLDDSSKAALMAAWTALYNSSNDGETPDPEPGVSTPDSPEVPAGEPDPLLDELLADDPGLLANHVPPESPPAPTPIMMPALPSMAGGVPPIPAAMTGGAPVPGALLPGLPSEPDARLAHDDARADLPVDEPLLDEDLAPYGSDLEEDDASEPGPDTPEAPPATDSTTVRLPDGQAVTAPNAQIAGVIRAAAAGTPIADAFRQQGITIPTPGTAVAHPVDAAHVAPGDIGMFTDRHALSIGNSKALLNSQIQPIASVSGPSFLGWEHPPAPGAAPAKVDTPAPTRPATGVGTSI